MLAELVLSAALLSGPSLVADKARGSITLYHEGATTTVPALYGRRKEDSIDWSYFNARPGIAPYITPAGKYKLKAMYSTRLRSTILVFHEGDHAVLAIHSVYVGRPEQRRVERLESASPDDNRITNGCINVPAEFMAKLLALPDGLTLEVLQEMPE